MRKYAIQAQLSHFWPIYPNEDLRGPDLKCLREASNTIRKFVRNQQEFQLEKATKSSDVQFNWKPFDQACQSKQRESQCPQHLISCQVELVLAPFVVILGCYGKQNVFCIERPMYSESLIPLFSGCLIYLLFKPSS